ncbi:MAG TPA: hypothetical protein PLA68_03165 [Panacibacter sp.]|nr:hypothetical protein [Panacibacter sp.]
MNGKNKIQKNNAAETKIVMLFISLVAIVAIVLAVYAFKQKKEAEEQTQIAKEKILQALQQQKIALEQRNIADSNKELALEQRELGLESEKKALEQKIIADTEMKRAEVNKQEALKQQDEADQQKANAEKQKSIAELNAQEAVKQQVLAENQKNIAEEEKRVAAKLEQLANSRGIAKESVLLLNENRFDSSRIKALEAYQLNKINNGPTQNADIYNALNANWAKSIGDKNQSGFHKTPVRCITGMPGNNIIFTADESGILIESIIANNSLQKIAAYATNEILRAISISPDGTKLVAISALGNAFVFSISSSGIVPFANFKFPGTGKGVAFTLNNEIVIASNKGIGKYRVSNNAIAGLSFLDYPAIAAFAAGKSGKFYIASGNRVKIYSSWENILYDSLAIIEQYDSKVSSLVVDDKEKYIAAGTYNGMVWMIDLKTGAVICNKALHLSSVNDLKIAVLDNGKMQLASAGADQTIKLTDINAILQKNYNQDIISLKGHTKWIYGLYYTPDGRWLFSAGEDNKVIAWRTTMSDLYQTLSNK